MPLIFHGSYIDGYPFPKLMDLGLSMLYFNKQDNKWEFKKIEPLDENHSAHFDGQ